MSNEVTSNAESLTSNRHGCEYLSFKLGEEEYAMDIQQVQELRRYETVTQIANAPEYVKGVVNLRGIIVPILDLRIKFQIGSPTYDEFTVVIILNIHNKLTGIVVDSVSDVVLLAAEDIRSAPLIQELAEASYLIGLGSIAERMLIVVDISKMLLSAQLGTQLDLQLSAQPSAQIGEHESELETSDLSA
ncbi:chemotaxis protein CheW [Undibacterium danionis]|uniref:Chemotaxis protein CheW n=1 Tax=Undibacterium danionis TaxID=1812100 RepID=A0ABV6IG16_9BURK